MGVGLKEWQRNYEKGAIFYTHVQNFTASSIAVIIRTFRDMANIIDVGTFSIDFFWRTTKYC
jgi:hypothetical protein